MMYQLMKKIQIVIHQWDIFMLQCSYSSFNSIFIISKASEEVVCSRSPGTIDRGIDLWLMPYFFPFTMMIFHPHYTNI